MPAAPESRPDAELCGWLSRLQADLEAARHPERHLAGTLPKPAGADGLRCLLDAWFDILRVNAADLLPGREAAARLANDLGGGNRAENIKAVVEEAVNRLDRLVGDALDNGLVDDRAVRTADFGDVRAIYHADLRISIYCGRVASLPEGHRLRTALAEDDFFRLEYRAMPSLVLGRTPHPNQAPPPRRWYPLDAALTATKVCRNLQREKERAEDEAKEAEEGKRRREFWASEAGQEELRRQWIERLKERGQLPAYQPAEPAVRGAGPRSDHTF